MTPNSTHDVDDQALEQLERLARLVIEPAERATLRHDLVALLGFVDTLLEADVEGVEEYVNSDSSISGTAIRQANTERPDVVTPSLPSARALALAPAAHDGFFKVPRTVEEG
ncbi:MAG TPA: Asp-tRNA(Asn)/Glu-tRNA(Gln) amidotransferase subunit GatC [Trueperaceae bacterium]|nr:Asp-tRNA(Asn)/Glu-tRNA(Gln) amidotransferase subunit GatC [Trueperaceae bacterium]